MTQLLKLKILFLEKKYATEDDIKVIDKRVKDLVSECEKFAEESPYPEKTLCMMLFTNKKIIHLYNTKYKLWQK